MLQVRDVTYNRKTGVYVCRLCEENDAAITFQVTHREPTLVMASALYLLRNSEGLTFQKEPYVTRSEKSRRESQNALRLSELITGCGPAPEVAS